MMPSSSATIASGRWVGDCAASRAPVRIRAASRTRRTRGLYRGQTPVMRRTGVRPRLRGVSTSQKVHWLINFKMGRLADDDSGFQRLAKFAQLILWHLMAADLAPGVLTSLGRGPETQVQRMLDQEFVVGFFLMIRRPP